MIPQKIHFVWVDGSPPMPHWMLMNVEKFRLLNPDYEVRIHGNEVLLPHYVDAYNHLEDTCSKSDLLALSAVERYGGWYFDTDYIPLRPVSDITSAYAVDGQRMFITEQHGQKNQALTMANGIIAGNTDSAAWPHIRAYCAAQKPPFSRCCFGPEMFTALVAGHVDLFTVGAWPWFYPAAIGRAIRIWKNGCRRMQYVAPTSGQMPFTLHLWAHGRTELSAAPAPELITELEPRGTQYKGLRVCYALLDVQWEDTEQPFHAIAQGLQNIGCTVEVWRLSQAVPDFDTSDMLIIWNGRKFQYEKAVSAARARHVPYIVFEHGFFDRRNYIHLNKSGILHWASWAHDWARPAPADGAARLAKVWPRPLGSFGRREGYVLVLGQMDGDSQLDDSTPCHALQVEKLVARNLPRGVRGVLRPHPNKRVKSRHQYLPRCQAATLAEAVAGAKFAVTINSNAGNECLAMGCPVLAFGPSLYGNAGVAHTTSLATFKRDLEEMVRGWLPKSDAVTNYLQWLACRQHNADELREGSVMAQLVQDARR